MAAPADRLECVRRQFQPAALELQDTPPSPTGRWLLWLLLSLFVTGIAWACLGKVDIVVTAPGRVVPSGQVKLVQAPQAGSVVAILASDGERVEAGQPLLRLDPTYAEADDLRIREQLHELALQAAWRSALDHWLADGRQPAAPSGLASRFAAADQARAEALYQLHRREITAALRAQEGELAANRAEQAALRAERERTQGDAGSAGATGYGLQNAAGPTVRGEGAVPGNAAAADRAGAHPAGACLARAAAAGKRRCHCRAH